MTECITGQYLGVLILIGRAGMNHDRRFFTAAIGLKSHRSSEAPPCTPVCANR